MKALLKRAMYSFDRLASNFRAADISVFHAFVPPPYGGGNQFLRGLWKECAARGWRMENDTISATTRACLYNSFNFDFDRLRTFRRDTCRMVHRVDGPIAGYRGEDDGTDRRIWTLNQELSDATIFQSHFSLRRHIELGLVFKDPHVIGNAADPAIFHARGREKFAGNRRLRLIASSWSSNLNKGADVYTWLDQHLDWNRFEFTFVGRSPVAFRNIRVHPPVGSEALADLLRQHDVFVIASRNESCSNALTEALSCGLPAIFLDSGSHSEVAGGGGLPFTTAEEIPALLDRMEAHYNEHQSRVVAPSLPVIVDRYLRVMGLLPGPAAA